MSPIEQSKLIVFGAALLVFGLCLGGLLFLLNGRSNPTPAPAASLTASPQMEWEVVTTTVSAPPSPTPEAIEVAVELLTPQPTTTTAVCTPLDAGMRLEIVPASETAFLLILTGFRPGDSLIFQFTGSAGRDAAAYESIPVNMVSSRGDFVSVPFKLSGYANIMEWQGKVIHSMGVACFDIVLPLAPESVVIGEHVGPTREATPAAPPLTRPLRTDQTVWFAQDDALWRSDMDFSSIIRISDSGFLGWDRNEPDFRDVRPRLSPNGRFVAQLSSTNSTRLLDLGTGREHLIPAAWEIAWSPNGRTVAYAPLSETQALWLADAVTGSTWELLSAEQLTGNGRVHNLAWNSDGTWLAFDCCFIEREPYDGFSDGLIQRVNINSGDVAVVTETWLGIASGPPDFCWTESGVTTQIDTAMEHCSINKSFKTYSVTSPHNRVAQWMANKADDGTWVDTRIFVTDGTDGPLLWQQTLPLQSYVVMAWSVDGRYLFLDDQTSDSPIWRINADGTGLVELLRNATLLGVVPAWSEGSTATYRDPSLGLSFQYHPSWQLMVQQVGTWQIITLSQNKYEFHLRVQPLPDEVPVCAGILTEANLNLFHTYSVAGIELWRAKAELGFVNGYQNVDITFVEIVSPSWYDQPTDQGILGEINCVFSTADKLLGVDYKLPVNIADLQAGDYEVGLLEDMDRILLSLNLELGK